MTQIVIIRGAPAVGKTTITREVLNTLKKSYGLDCAYICEDNFRKQMQFKYKAADLAAHKNSVKLIELIIKKLLSMDNYDYIFIEGLFRYKPILLEYMRFAKKHNFKLILFELRLDISEMKKRDVTLRNTRSKDIEEVKRDIDSFTPENAIIIETTKSISHTTKTIIKRLLQ